jgi:hypothetical protein
VKRAAPIITPRLRWKACLRGKKAAAARRILQDSGEWYDISGGPLRGCWHKCTGTGDRDLVLRVMPKCVLLFTVVEPNPG